MEKLQTRFLPDAAQASDKFTSAKLSLRDIAQDESALVLFIQKKLRYAKAMGLLAPSSVNWHSVMIQIWSSMSLDIRQYLRAPLRTGTLASYMLQVEEARVLLNTLAYDVYPNIVRNRSKAKTLRSGSQGHSSCRDDSYRRDGDGRHFSRPFRDKYRSNSYRDDRNEPRRSQHSFHDRSDKYRGSNDRRDNRDHHNKDHRREHHQDDRRGKDPRDNHKRTDSHGKKDSKDRSYQIDEESDDMEKENMSDSDDSLSSAESVHHISEVTSLKRRTCRSCHDTFSSRNKLFIHLETGCPSTKASVESESTSSSNSDTVHHTLEVVEEIKPTSTMESLEGNFTHMRLKIRAAVDNEEEEICIDCGSGHNIVDRNFLKKKFDHTISSTDKPLSLKGYGGRIKRHSEWAEWFFFVKGNKPDGTPIFAKMSATAWVTDKLDANCLLGNTWMNPREVEIRQQPSLLIFPQIAGGFRTLVDVLKPNRFVVRKVTAAGNVILPPGVAEHIKVDYISLPKGRSYNFSATHPTAANALIDASSPKICLLTNSTSKFWNAFWDSFKTRLMMTTAWHPQSNGQSEVKNKIAELAIRYHAYENPDEDWVDLIPALQWNLNNAHSRVIPHEYLFGFKIAGPLDRLTGGSKEATDVRFMRKTIESVIVEGNNIFFLSRHLL